MAKEVVYHIDRCRTTFGKESTPDREGNDDYDRYNQYSFTFYRGFSFFRKRLVVQGESLLLFLHFILRMNGRSAVSVLSSFVTKIYSIFLFYYRTKYSTFKRNLASKGENFVPAAQKSYFMKIISEIPVFFGNFLMVWKIIANIFDNLENRKILRYNSLNSNIIREQVTLLK